MPAASTIARAAVGWTGRDWPGGIAPAFAAATCFTAFAKALIFRGFAGRHPVSNTTCLIAAVVAGRNELTFLAAKIVSFSQASARWPRSAGEITGSFQITLHSFS